MSDNIVHIPVNLDYAKRGDPTTLAFLRQSAERKEKEAGWQPMASAPLATRLLFWWRPIDDNPYAECCVIGSISTDDWHGEEGWKPTQWWDGRRGEYQSIFHLVAWRELPGKPQLG